MTQLQRPNVGQKIEVVIDNKNYGGPIFYFRPNTETFVGTVIDSPKWLKEHQFAMTSGLPKRYNFPFRVITLEKVLEINEVDIDEDEEIETLGDVIEEVVKGSKDNTYIVRRENDKWSCTCPAGSYRKGDCKHVKAMKEKHED